MRGLVNQGICRLPWFDVTNLLKFCCVKLYKDDYKTKEVLHWFMENYFIFLLVEFSKQPLEYLVSQK